MFCLVHFVESGIFCTNPQTGRDGHHASMFDQLISIWNPVFRSQNLNDDAADAKSRSPALSANRIYAFWEAVGGRNCSTEELKYAQGFCVAEPRPPPPLYTNRCGHAHPAISPFKDHSPTTRNVLIKYSLQIIPFGLMFLFPPLFWFGKAKNGGWELRVGGKGPCFDQSGDWLSVVLQACCYPVFLLFSCSLRLIGPANVWLWVLLRLAARNVLLKRQESHPSDGCKSIDWRFHGLLCGLKVIFLHFKNTQWNLAAMNNYCLPNLPSFKYIIPSSCHPLLFSQSLLCWIQYQVV